MSMKDIVIIGAGDFGKEVAWLIGDINKKAPTYNIIGYLDDDQTKIGQRINGYECLGPVSYLTELTDSHNLCATIANQNGEIRKKFVDMFPSFEAWETLVHPSVNISETSSIGKGTIICAGGNVSVNTAIGDFCLLNLSAIVGHDCVIENYASVMSGVAISGHIQIKEGAYLGSNCTILPGMKVGRHSKVGAGSVVLRNVKDEITVMGVPAKMVSI